MSSSFLQLGIISSVYFHRGRWHLWPDIREWTVSIFMNDKHKQAEFWIILGLACVACSYLVDTLIGGDNEEEEEEQGEKEAVLYWELL